MNKYGSFYINNTDGSLDIGKLANSDITITSPADGHLFLIKAYLCDNHILTMPTDISGWVFDPNNSNCAYEVDRSKDYTGKYGYHQMTIVGYDDNKTMTDGKGHTFVGAFKVANSWGTNWENGDNGFAWLAYDALIYI